MNIKKGDTVKIMAGKDKGKQGKVTSINPKDGRIIVDGVNLTKKHQRPKKQGEKGEIITVTRSIEASNSMIICNSCSKPTRVGYKQEGDSKVRYCKKCEGSL